MAANDTADKVAKAVSDYVRTHVETSLREKNLHIADAPHVDIQHMTVGRPSGGLGDPGTQKHGVQITVTLPLK